MIKRLLQIAWLAVLVPGVAYAQPGAGRDDHHPPKGASTNGQRPPEGKAPGKHAPPKNSARPPQPGAHNNDKNNKDGRHSPPGPGSANQPPPKQPGATGPSGHNPGGNNSNARPPHRRHGPDRANEITEARKDLPKARKKTREESRDDLRRRYANTKDDKGRKRLRSALSTHAQRMARLSRLREVAVKRGDTGNVTRVDTLMTKENQRHERWLSANAPAQ